MSCQLDKTAIWSSGSYERRPEHVRAERERKNIRSALKPIFLTPCSLHPAPAPWPSTHSSTLAQSFLPRPLTSQLRLCPNSITSILLKSCLKPGFRQVLSRKKSETRFPTSFEQKKSRKPGAPTKKVANVSLSKFHYIYLAQNLLKTRFPTSFEQKKSRRPGLRFFLSKKSRETWSPTCLRPGLRQVVRQVVRQDRSNGIWALPNFRPAPFRFPLYLRSAHTLCRRLPMWSHLSSPLGYCLRSLRTWSCGSYGKSLKMIPTGWCRKFVYCIITHFRRVRISTPYTIAWNRPICRGVMLRNADYFMGKVKSISK